MATWSESELAVTQSLQRIEEAALRIEDRLIEVEKQQSNQSGKATVLTVIVSAIVTVITMLLSKLLYRGT